MFPLRPLFMLGADLSSILFDGPSDLMLNELSAEKEEDLLGRALAMQAERQRTAAKEEEQAA